MQGVNRKVVETISAANDLEINVSVLTSETHDDYIEVRYFTPSIDRYGRGIVFPRALRDDLVTALLNA